MNVTTLKQQLEAAQQEIVNVAKRLESEGKIMINRGGGEDTLV